MVTSRDQPWRFRPFWWKAGSHVQIQRSSGNALPQERFILRGAKLLIRAAVAPSKNSIGPIPCFLLPQSERLQCFPGLRETLPALDWRKVKRG